MNTKQKHRIKAWLMVGCILLSIGLALGLQVMASSAEQEMVIVSNLAQLQTAITNADDGDVIGIDNGIIIDSDVVIGLFNKTITIKRMQDISYIHANANRTVSFQNIIFDGNGVNSYYPLLIIDNDYVTLFEKVTFQNVNAIPSGGSGGAVLVNRGTVYFRNCLFDNNQAVSGGHLALTGNSEVIVQNSILQNGYASSDGGAISVANNSTTCRLESSVVTGNTASGFGGGAANNGLLDIRETKIYNNTASCGGSDLYNTGSFGGFDSIEELEPLFFEDGLKPLAWVYDYTDDYSESNAWKYMKLQFEEIQPSEEETPDPSDDDDDDDESGQDPDDSEQTDPNTSSNSDQDQDKDPDPSENPDQEQTQPADEDLDSGEEPPSDSEQETDNHDESSEHPKTNNPDDNDGQSESSQEDNDSGINQEQESDSGNDSQTEQQDQDSTIDQGQQQDDSKDSDSQTPVTPSNTSSSTSTVTTNSTTDSSVTNNRDTRTTDSNNSTTINNYYPDDRSTQPQTQQQTKSENSGNQSGNMNYVQQPQISTPIMSDSQEYETASESSAAPSPNIKIEAKGVDCIFESGENGISIYINANSNTTVSPDAVPVMASAVFSESSHAESEKDFSWYQIAVVGTLLGILVCVIRKK